MKLSEVSAFLELLRNTDTSPAWIEFQNKLYTIRTAAVDHPVQIGNVAHDIVTSMNNVQASVGDFQNNVVYLMSQLEAIIQQGEAEYYQESYRLYEEEMCWETNDYILNRRLLIDADSDLIIRSRIKNYGDWRLPGMIIRPAQETHIEELVPLDPLYVLDQHDDLIMPAIGKFTQDYQRRLRPYVINDYKKTSPLEELPSNQFGLIFTYNFLNYKPIEVIERYLRDFYLKLRPGGVALFTYNNCDLANGVALAEQHFMCYTPGKRIQAIAHEIGFENTFNQPGVGNLSWMELKKPGEITSLRGGQALAKVLRK